MKISVVLSLSFLLTASAYAQLAWLPYEPSGDYGDSFAVIGTVEGDSRGEVCKTVDASGTPRIGKVSSAVCLYGTDRERERSPSWLRDSYEYGSSESFEVLTAQSPDDFAWIESRNADYDQLFVTTIDGIDFHVCRSVNKTLARFRIRERGTHSGHLYIGLHSGSKCYYEYGSRGHISPDAYTSEFEVLIDSDRE